jgi:hypothetical protein
MNFGFPRWTDPNAKSGTAGRLLASIDGYHAYFLVLDRKTRFFRGVFTVNKQPPVQFMERDNASFELIRVANYGDLFLFGRQLSKRHISWSQLHLMQLFKMHIVSG